MNITAFSALVCAGTALALAMYVLLSRRKGLSSRAVELSAVIMPLLGAFCGHFLYCAVQPWEWMPLYGFGFLFAPWLGGFMWYGALIGCVLGVLIACRIGTKARALSLLDCLAPALLVLIAVIRFAEPLDGQGRGMGLDEDSPLRFFPLAFANPEYPDEWSWSVFMAEGLWALIAAGLSVRRLFRADAPAGRTAAFSLTLYAAAQILLESLRRDTVVVWRFTRVSQIISALCLLGLVITAIVRRRVTRKGAVGAIAGLLVLAGAIIALEFSVDKPLELPDGSQYEFPYWLTYLLIGVCGAGMGVITWRAFNRPDPVKE